MHICNMEQHKLSPTNTIIEVLKLRIRIVADVLGNSGLFSLLLTHSC